MLHSTDSSFVELFASLPKLAQFTSFADRMHAAAETLVNDGWTGVQILLFERQAGVAACTCGTPSLVIDPEAVSRKATLFHEVLQHHVINGIGSITYADAIDFQEFAVATPNAAHDLIVMPLSAQDREFGVVFLNAPNAAERPLTGLRIWIDIFASMIDADMQSTFYGELEYLMSALQGITDIDHILQVVVELLAGEFDATCVAWQAEEPRWRMAAIMPAGQREPNIALIHIDFDSRRLSSIDGMRIAPLYVEGVPWGALAIEEAAIGGERLSFFQTVAYHLEVALSTAVSFNKQRLLAQESTALCDASRTLLGFTRLEPLAQAVSRLAVGLVAGDEAALYVATDDNYARVGFAPETISPSLVDLDDLQWTRDTGQSYRSADGRSIVVPLREAGASLNSRFAVLVVSRADRSTHFSYDDTRKLEAFGALCAMALRNVRLYEEASEANLALSDINAFKDDLLAMFTHDFKGPLTVISGYGELVLEKLEGDERENLGIILRQVKRLATLADDTLALARAQADGFVLQLEHGALQPFLHDVLRTSFGTQGGRIVAQLQPATITLAFDPIAMRHVLENIIGNALKYSNQQIRIELDIDGADAVIAVRDRGIGIPASELPDIFGRFARASNARRRGISGSGVGLYLAKRLIEQHGGSISVASIEGEGSTFEIRLPTKRGGTL